MDFAIQTDGLSKRYRAVLAVDRLSLRVFTGEIYAFLGLNGAGKTTTIRQLLGMVRPTAGSAVVLGTKVQMGSSEPWSQVGSLVEIPHSYPELTVRENLEVARQLHPGVPTRLIAEVIDRLRLSEYADRRAGDLSQGNAQRLGLAKALLHGPKLLILDEPTNGLDPVGIVEIRELLVELSRSRGVTVFISSHILAEVARLADRIGIIHQGRLLKEIGMSELERDRRRRLLVRGREPLALRSALTEIGGSFEGLSGGAFELIGPQAVRRPDEIARLLIERGIALTHLVVEEEDLESYFLRLIGEPQGSRDSAVSDLLSHPIPPAHADSDLLSHPIPPAHADSVLLPHPIPPEIPQTYQSNGYTHPQGATSIADLSPAAPAPFIENRPNFSPLRLLASAFWIESLKARRSRLPLLTALGFLLMPLALALIMLIYKDPELARRAGLITAKANLMGGAADWPTYISMLAQTIAIAGLMLFTLVESWVFGREFVDRTLKDLLAVPMPRPAIVTAKFILTAVWCILLSASIFVLALVAGALIGLPGGSPLLFANGAVRLMVTAVIVFLLITPNAFFASVGRGYLLPLGAAMLMLVFAQIFGILGWGEIFPWAIPALYAGMGGDTGGLLPPASLVAVLLTAAVGILLTLAWWEWADQSK